MLTYVGLGTRLRNHVQLRCQNYFIFDECLFGSREWSVYNTYIGTVVCNIVYIDVGFF